MATGPLSFRTPHIEEIPIVQTKQAPGFAWVAVAKGVDPARKQLEVAGKKRARGTGLGPTDAQKEVLSARQQRELERRIRDLNTDGSKDANITIPKRAAGQSSGGVKGGKTLNTKKILASGKEFKHYLDDEEAELARTGKVDGVDREDPLPLRTSKTPLSRRLIHEDTNMTDSSATPMPPPIPYFAQNPPSSQDLDDDVDAIAAFPSAEVIEALLIAPPLTYNAATRTPSYRPVAPPRAFCDICGYWGLSKCLKCGAKTCSIECETIHVTDRCLKFYS